MYILRSGPAGSHEIDKSWEALPRGNYRLEFVSDAPGRAAVTIPGLTGSAPMHPSSPLPATIAPLRIRRAEQRANGLTVMGETHMLKSDGVAIGYISVQHSQLGQRTPSLDRLEFCSYIGGARSAGKKAYSPGCSGAGAGGSQSTNRDYASGTVSNTGPLPVGLGGNLKSSDPNPHIQAYGIWLSFAPRHA